MNGEKEAFLKAIRDNPTDITIRMVFSDWLEEHGFDDEAAFFRRHSQEDLNSAKAYLEGFASRLTYHEAYRPYHDDQRRRPYLVRGEDFEPALDLNGLLEAARVYLRSGNRHYLLFDLPDYLEQESAQFWRAFGIYEGYPNLTPFLTDDKIKDYGAWLFHCSC